MVMVEPSNSGTFRPKSLRKMATNTTTPLRSVRIPASHFLRPAIPLTDIYLQPDDGDQRCESVSIGPLRGRQPGLRQWFQRIVPLGDLDRLIGGDVAE